MHERLMGSIGDGVYMRRILRSRLAGVADLMLSRVEAEIREWIDGDENVADVRVDLVGLVAFLELLADGIFGEDLQGG